MRRLVFLAPVLVLPVALAACGGDDTTAAGTGGDTDASTGPDTNGSVSMTTSVSDTTATSTTDTTVDPDSSTGDEACVLGEDECVTADECLLGQSCVGCICVGDQTGCNEWGEGAYGDCVTQTNAACMGGASLGCLVDNVTTPTAGVCFFSCAETCDCPAPPAGFEAQVTCGNITGEDGECYIDCAGGQDCPEEMFCLGNQLCVWGEEPTPRVVPPYGDCVSPQEATCENRGTCLVDDPAGASFGACAEPCTDPTDCSPAPGGDAEVACQTFGTPPNTLSLCVLDCSGGETCPDGMVCDPLGIGLCVWELQVPPQEGFGDCANFEEVDACLETEACILDDTQDPDTSVCSAQCTAADECPLAPATGDAPVACGDIGTGIDTCYLDCSAAQTCPDGMVCVADDHCMFEGDATTVFAEDFEGGVLPANWLIADEDGNTPNAEVAFVDAAWIVTDELEPTENLAAYSTSYYTPAGAADDWLITPQINLGTSAALRWRAQAFLGSFPDGYEVRISTAGTAIADFEANAALFAVAAEESGGYALRTVDLALAGYANQAVHFAFRNNSNDQFILMVDDVRVTE